MTLTALVAAIGAVGFASVPGLRLLRGVEPRRNLPLTVGLVGAPIGFAVALAALFGSLDLERILFAPAVPGFVNPPNLVLLAPLAALGVVSAARLPVPSWAGGAIRALSKIRNGPLTCAILAVSFGLLGVWSGIDLVEAGFDGGATWQLLSAISALALTPLVAAFSLARWGSRRRQGC